MFAGLDVAVDDARRVSRVEPVGNLDRQIEQFVDLVTGYPSRSRRRKPVPAYGFSVWPSRYSMAMKGLPCMLPNLMDGADIGMVQCRGSAGFAQEAVIGLLILGDVIGQEFEGHEAMPSLVSSAL